MMASDPITLNGHNLSIAEVWQGAALQAPCTLTIHNMKAPHYNKCQADDSYDFSHKQ